ncbi:hypothetical protein [Streptomyces violaceusniger]|uniref:Uncharacterized protein n=1 Tax=Streptomyces violaceusniger (strain Tu 4113) TaxID=653045 RepID=G2P7B2_STRV4|nr:hypothetical protein [Streptomyces violaceusniger]AEM87072.1 hypothetical protein Strvi_7737 [Streptomyces violaceusniger Tu 4113]
MSGVVIDQWTGRTASLLQAAFRMTNEGFAEYLGVAVRTVAAWNVGPHIKPRSEMQRLLDTAYEKADETTRSRFARNFAPVEQPAPAMSKEADRIVSAMAGEMTMLQARVDVLQQQVARLSRAVS